MLNRRMVLVVKSKRPLGFCSYNSPETESYFLYGNSYFGQWLNDIQQKTMLQDSIYCTLIFCFLFPY